MATLAPTTLVFDIDDTLYDVGSGFTAHRNGPGVLSFMMHRLGFETSEAAQAVRDEYFAKFHSTVKALTIAEADGRLPAGAHFEAEELATWWATKLDFSSLPQDEQLVTALRDCPLKLVAFTNAPRKYALRVLDALGLRGPGLFTDDNVTLTLTFTPLAGPVSLLTKPCAFAALISHTNF
jgi:putative hydrolase of the HAD superfamily